MRRLVATCSMVAAVVPGVSACGSSQSGGGGAGLPTKHVAITFHGSDVSPNGTDVDLPARAA